MTHATASFTITSFRGYESDAVIPTPLADADTNFGYPPDTTFQVRLVVAETNGGSQGNINFDWQYRHVEGTNTWTNITTTSSVVKAVSLYYFADGDNCSQRLGSGTFVSVNSGYTDDGSAGGDADFTGNDEAETEIALQFVSGDVSLTDTVELRCLIEGTAPAGTPTLPLVSVHENRTVSCTTEELDITAPGGWIPRPCATAQLGITLGLAGDPIEIGYYDGTDGITNDNSAWTNPSNAFDGSELTYAETTATPLSRLTGEGYTVTTASNLDYYVGGISRALVHTDSSTTYYGSIWANDGMVPTYLLDGISLAFDATGGPYSYTTKQWVYRDEWVEPSSVPWTLLGNFDARPAGNADATPPFLDKTYFNGTTANNMDAYGGAGSGSFSGGSPFLRLYKMEMLVQTGRMEWENSSGNTVTSIWQNPENAHDGVLTTFTTPQSGYNTDPESGSFSLDVGNSTWLDNIPDNGRIVSFRFRFFGYETSGSASLRAKDSYYDANGPTGGNIVSVINTGASGAWSDWSLPITDPDGLSKSELTADDLIQLGGVAAISDDIGIASIELGILWYKVGTSNALVQFDGTSYLGCRTEELDITTTQATVTFEQTQGAITCSTEALDITPSSAFILPLLAATEALEITTTSATVSFGYVPIVTTEYYQNDPSPRDDQGAWTNDTNATDGSTSTYASSTSIGTLSSNEMQLDGGTNFGRNLTTIEQYGFLNADVRAYLGYTGTDVVASGVHGGKSATYAYGVRFSFKNQSGWTPWQHPIIYDYAQPPKAYLTDDDCGTAIVLESGTASPELRVYKSEIRFSYFESITFKNYWYEFENTDITDADAAWNNDSGAAGGCDLINNGAQLLAGNSSTSDTSNTLVIKGTDAPAKAALDLPELVFVRWKAQFITDAYETFTLNIYTQGKGTLLKSIPLTRLTNAEDGYTISPWTELDAPSGGWTWAHVQNLEAYIFGTGATATSPANAGGISIKVGVLNKSVRKSAQAKKGNVKKDRTVTCTTEQLQSTETNALVSINFITPTEQLDITANAANVESGNLTVTCTTEELDIANTNATVLESLSFTTTTEELDIANTNATVSRVHLVTTPTEELDITDTDATVNLARGVLGVTEELDITDTDATVSATRGVLGATEALDITHTDATVNSTRDVLGATEELDITDTDATINLARGVLGATEELDITDTDASVNATFDLLGATEELDITDTDATVNLARGVLGATEQLQLTDNDATVETTANNRDVICTTEALDLANTNATVARVRLVTGATEQLDITDTDATVSLSKSVLTTTEALDLANTNATVNRSNVTNGVTEALQISDADSAINASNITSSVTEALQITDTDATVTRPNTTLCTTEQLDITDSDASINATLVVAGLTEELDITENAAQITAGVNLNVNCSTEALDLATTDAAINKTLVVASATEALEITNPNASATLDLSITGATEALQITDNDSAVNASRPVATTTHALQISDTDASINATNTTTAVTEELAVTESGAAISADRGVLGVTETLDIATSLSSLNRALGLLGQTEQLDIAAAPAQVFLGTNLSVTCATEQLDIATAAANVVTDRGVLAATEALTIADADATVTRGTTITGATESLSLADTDASVNASRSVVTFTELLEIDESAAVVFKGQNLDVVAGTEALTLTDSNAIVSRGFRVTGFTESLDIATQTAVVLRPLTLLTSTEALEIATLVASVSKRIAGTMPGEMIYARPTPESYVYVDNKFMQL